MAAWRLVTLGPPGSTASLGGQSWASPCPLYTRASQSPGQCGSIGWVAFHEPNIAGSIPGQGTCLSCGFGPQLGSVQKETNQCFFLTSIFLSLSLSLLFLSLSLSLSLSPSLSLPPSLSLSLLASPQLLTKEPGFQSCLSGEVC